MALSCRDDIVHLQTQVGQSRAASHTSNSSQNPCLAFSL